MVQANEPFKNRTEVSGFQMVLNHQKQDTKKSSFWMNLIFRFLNAYCTEKNKYCTNEILTTNKTLLGTKEEKTKRENKSFQKT